MSLTCGLYGVEAEHQHHAQALSSTNSAGSIVKEKRQAVPQIIQRNTTISDRNIDIDCSLAADPQVIGGGLCCDLGSGIEFHKRGFVRQNPAETREAKRSILCMSVGCISTHELKLNGSLMQ